MNEGIRFPTTILVKANDKSKVEYIKQMRTQLDLVPAASGLALSTLGVTDTNT